MDDVLVDAKLHPTIPPPSDPEARAQCRICFATEFEDDTGPLISPCACRGSMRFVHAECLQTWRAHSAKSSRTSFIFNIAEHLQRKQSWFDASTASVCTECGVRYRRRPWPPRQVFTMGIFTSHIVLTALSLLVVVVGAILTGYSVLLFMRLLPLPESLPIYLPQTRATINKGDSTFFVRMFPEHTEVHRQPETSSAAPSLTTGSRHALPTNLDTLDVPYDLRKKASVDTVGQGLPRLSLLFLDRLSTSFLWYFYTITLVVDLSLSQVELLWMGARLLWVLTEASLELRILTLSRYRTDPVLRSHCSRISATLEMVRTMGDHIFGPMFRTPFCWYSPTLYLSGQKANHGEPSIIETFMLAQLERILNLNDLSLTVDRVFISCRIILAQYIIARVLPSETVAALPAWLTWNSDLSPEASQALMLHGGWVHHTLLPSFFSGFIPSQKQYDIASKRLPLLVTDLTSMRLWHESGSTAGSSGSISFVTALTIGLMVISPLATCLSTPLLWRADGRFPVPLFWSVWNNREIWQDSRMRRAFLTLVTFWQDCVWLLWAFEAGVGMSFGLVYYTLQLWVHEKLKDQKLV